MRQILIVVLALCAAACQMAQPAARVDAPALAALRGGYFELNSASLGRPMQIHIALPEGYAEQPTRGYPVVYLTDGDSLFPLLAPTHLFLTYDEPIPPAIIVGIAYGTFDPNAGNMRHVDFNAPQPGVTTGAPAFHRFLSDELIPAVERRYRANPERRILVGQSRGGGFVIYSALAEPDLFWGRIASNPAFRPAASREFFYGPAAQATRADLGLFVVSGARDRPDIRAETLRWFEHWNAQSERPWTLNTVTLENGTHAASIGETYRQGLLWLFRNEPPPG